MANRNGYSYNITADGVLDSDYKQATSDMLRIQAGGTFGGATITFSVWLGDSGSAPSGVSDADFVDSISLTSAAVGSTGVKWDIGKWAYYKITVSGSGGSTDINLVVSNAQNPNT